MKILKFIFLLFVLSLPFTSAFALHAIASIPVALSLLLFVIYLSGVFWHKFSWIGKNSLLLFLFFIVIMISFFLNEGNKKSVNHLFLYFLAVFVLYFGNRNIAISIIRRDRGFYNRILKYLTVTLFIASTFAVVEFLCMNVFHFNINSIIPREYVSEYEPLFMGYIRARSFIEESGHFIFFLESLAPLSIYYLFQNRVRSIYRWIYCINMIMAILFTFSSFGYAMMISSAIILLYYYFKYFNKNINVVVKFFIIASCLIVILFLLKDIIDLFYNVVSVKTIGSDNYKGRMNNSAGAISHFNNMYIVFGYGPASYNSLNEGSYFSFFYTVLLDSGIVGFACLVLFLLKQAVFILRIKNKPFQCCCLISFLTATAHYVYIGNYYYPWYWFFFSMMYIYYLMERKKL